ncbi:enoyl-CoA hydratase/isomerase family protein [Rhodobacterales bacterium FZCC0083]|nr:enoyl-CoA hydratase/isomerase family protein [Rhodobacterales bacterium FZCC0083]
MTAETVLENDGIRLVRDGPVAELTIEREARRNSLDNLALEAIIAATRRIARSDIAVCVVASEGTKAFCAGSDLKALVGYDLSEKVLHTRLFQEAMTAVDELPCATIAAIEGFCLGGGLELALGCDLRIASEKSVFGFPEITVGALPTGGATLRAPRAVGMARAREMMIFAERMSAQEAEDRGLVSKISTPGKIREMARKKAAEFAENVAPSSVRLMKTLLHNGFATPERATADLAALVDQILLASENSQAAMGAAAKT